MFFKRKKFDDLDIFKNLIIVRRMKAITSNRTLTELNFIRYKLSEIHHIGFNKKVALQILFVMMTTPATYKGRNKNPEAGQYGIIKSTELFYEIYGEKFDSTKKHKKLLKEINDCLEAMSQTYDSMYGKNNMLIKRHEKYDPCGYEYMRKEDNSYSRTSYITPKLINFTVSSEQRRLYNWQLPRTVMTAVLITALQGGIPFTSTQIRNIFGLDIYNIKKACQDLGIILHTCQSDASWFEKKSYEISKQKLFRGYFFDPEGVDKAQKFLDALAVKIHWENLFKLRTWFYENQQNAEKKFFYERNRDIDVQLEKSVKDINKIRWSKSFFEKVSGHQVKKNAVVLNKTACTESDHFGSQKSGAFQNALANGSRFGNPEAVETKKFKEKIDRKAMEIRTRLTNNKKGSDFIMPTFNKHEGELTSMMTSRTDALLNAKERQQLETCQTWLGLCKASRKAFNRIRNEKRTIMFWEKFRSELLELRFEVKELGGWLERELRDITVVEKIFLSPVYEYQFAEFVLYTFNMLESHAQMVEHGLRKTIEKKTMSNIEFDEKFLALKSIRDEKEFENHKKAMLKSDLRAEQRRRLEELEVRKEVVAYKRKPRVPEIKERPVVQLTGNKRFDELLKGL